MSVLESLSTEYLTVRNPIYATYDNAVITGAADDTHDIGWAGSYWDGTTTHYTGLYRDATVKRFRFYDTETIPNYYNGFISVAGTNFQHVDLEVAALYATSTITSYSIVNSTSPTTGSVTTSGGLGVALNTFLGGLLNVASTVTVQSIVNSTSPTTGSIITAGGLGVALNTFLGGLLNVASTLTVQSTVNSTSSITGSIKTAGGLGVALDTFLGGNLTVQGSSTAIQSASVFLDDNILPINCGNVVSQKEDSGFVGDRMPSLVGANDTPTFATQALLTNYTANSTSITIVNASVGSQYFKGWYIKDNTGGSEVKLIVSDTDNGGNHTFTLQSGFTNARTAGTDNFGLYKRRFAGWIWDESLTKLSAFGFPREDLLSILDPSATDGSAPDYLDVAVYNLTVNGSLTVTGGVVISPNPVPTLTLTTNHTMTSAELKNYSIIWINPSSDPVTITMPALSSLTLTGYAYRNTYENVHPTNRVIISRGSTDLIEGNATYTFKKQWQKFTLITTPFSSNWSINQ